MRDFTEISERDSVKVEKKENPGRNIVVCDNEVEKRREPRIPANTILLGRYVAGKNVKKLKRIAAKRNTTK